MFDRLKLIDKQYKEIQDKLASGKLEVKEMTTLLKESSSIQEIVEVYHHYLEKEKELEDLNDIIEHEMESEIVELAEIERDEIEQFLSDTEEKLKILLLPKDPNDEKNVIMEIKGAAGGDEANIFAGDLFRMYSRYAEIKGWKIEILNAMEGSMGGFTSIDFMVSGNLVYSFLKYELVSQ
jgi:peptide chain release factor 1